MNKRKNGANASKTPLCVAILRKCKKVRYLPNFFQIAVKFLFRIFAKTRAKRNIVGTFALLGKFYKLLSNSSRVFWKSSLSLSSRAFVSTIFCCKFFVSL